MRGVFTAQSSTTTPQVAPGINRAEWFVRCGAAALSILVVRLYGPAPFLAEIESRNPCKLADSRRPKTYDVGIDIWTEINNSNIMFTHTELLDQRNIAWTSGFVNRPRSRTS